VNKKPNVILIVLDTTRADAIYPLDTNDKMPFLNKFSKECVVFDNAISPGSWTIPAHASILTGQYQSRNGVKERINGEIPNYSEIFQKYEGKTIAEILSERGYKTIGYSQNLLIAPDTSFSRGFDEFLYTHNENQDIYFRMLENYNKLVKTYGTTPAKIFPKLLGIHKFKEFLELYKKVKNDTKWLKSSDLTNKGGEVVIERIIETELNDPFFLFINLMEMHDPHDKISLNFGWSDSFFRDQRLDNDTIAEVRKSYFNATEKVDGLLSKLFTNLEKRNILDDTLIIITSDHGQSLMEKDDFFGHGTFLYDELIKVPLIIRLPGGIKFKINEGYQSTSRIATFINSFINSNEAIDTITEEFVFSECYGSLDNELDKYREHPKYQGVLNTVDRKRKAILWNNFKLVIDFNEDRVEEFTRNSVPVNPGDFKSEFDNMKEKLEVFSWNEDN
jgi:arylsulfatase A-like enzyme